KSQISLAAWLSPGRPPRTERVGSIGRALRGLGTTGPLQSGDPSGIQIASLTARRRTITMNATLLILRMVGLGLAAHGAQKLFGWFGGDGISGTGAFFQSIGFRAGWSICPNCAAGTTIFCRLERSGR